jgi:hypothetical protein
LLLQVAVAVADGITQAAVEQVVYLLQIMFL